MKRFFKQHSSEVLGACLCLALGCLSGYVSGSGRSPWFMSLNKPFFDPPGWIFGPVWTVLYILMGIAFGKIWAHRKHSALPLILFLAQLILNLAWAPIFFGFRRIDLALYVIILLWISLLGLLITVRKEKTVFLLLLPYMLWVSFAMVLNFSLYFLNT